MSVQRIDDGLIVLLSIYAERNRFLHGKTNALKFARSISEANRSAWENRYPHHPISQREIDEDQVSKISRESRELNEKWFFDNLGFVIYNCEVSEGSELGEILENIEGVRLRRALDKNSRRSLN